MRWPIIILSALLLFPSACDSGKNDDPMSAAPVTAPAAIGSDYDVDFSDRPLDRIAAARLLSRASFGATDQSIEEAVALGNEQAWVDARFPGSIGD